MVEIIVYLNEDYSINESIFVTKGLTKEEIKVIVDDNFEVWYYFDVVSEKK